MKIEDKGSPQQSPQGPESPGDPVYDFLYVDRPRVSALYAQLFPQGALTSIKTHSQITSSDDRDVGTDFKIFKAATKSTDGSTEGIEHSFDASWAIPVEVLTALQERGLVRLKLLDNATLGMIVLKVGFLRIIDYASMNGLWDPIVAIHTRGDPQPNMETMVKLLRNLPQTIHAHLLTDEAYLWASLEASNLTVPTSDIALKHGGQVSGAWKVLFMLDAFPDSGNAPDFTVWSAGEATNGVLTAIHTLRAQIGRPTNWFGITPLMIFRQIAPYSPQTSLDLTPGTQV